MLPPRGRDAPAPAKLKITGEHEKSCHAGADERELIEQTWLVNKDNKGVSDVIIFLQPPEGKFFPIHKSYLNKKDNFVPLHQPHCAFIPHVFPYWASYYDPAKIGPFPLPPFPAAGEEFTP